MAAPEPSPADLDDAIAGWLREESETAFHRVAGLGPAALRRAVALYYGHSSWDRPPELGRGGRELADAWAILLGRLGHAFPSCYLDEIDARRITLTHTSAPTSEVVILGRLTDPRAVVMLVKCARHRDWLVRLHAVRGLAWRDDADAIAAVGRAAREDCSAPVRVEAAAGVARRDPARAVILYHALLEHPHLTPMLRKRVKVAITGIDEREV